MTSGTFRDLLRAPRCVAVPAVYDVLSARIAEQLGVPGIGLGGFLVAASRLGGPDVGQLTMSEMVEHVRAVTGAVSIPVLADGDTGYGNPLNVGRTVQAYEAAGARRSCSRTRSGRRSAATSRGPAGSSRPTRTGRSLRPRRRRGATRAPSSSRAPTPGVRSGSRKPCVGPRRTDRTGADGIFLEALRSEAEFRAAPQALPRVPLIANMFTGGKSPLFTAAELTGMGYRVALWVVDALWVAAQAVQDVLSARRRDGTTAAVRDRLRPFDDYFALVGLPEYEALERRYADGEDPLRS